MKATHAPAALVFGLLLQASLFGQTVNILTVSKVHSFTQTNASTVEDTVNPWSFSAQLAGSGDLSGAAPVLTIPSGTGSTAMTYHASGPKWNVQASFASQAALDAAYGDGSYSLTAYGQTVSPISLSGDIYPSAPLASLSGGTIAGGVLNWDPSQALTITISGVADHMAIFVDGASFDQNNQAFGVGTLSFTIDAGSMLAGNSYSVELDFDKIVGGSLGSFGGTGAMSSAQFAGVYSADTFFTINTMSSVPEPTTYTAIFGAVAIAGVMYRRRRKTS